VNASPSSAGLSRLESYLATNDAVVVLSGTPDTFFGPNWGPPEGYDEAVTVANVAGMVEATLLDGAEPVLVAPPPVYEPYSGNGGLSCELIDGRLADLSVALDNLAFQEDVAFVDLYTLFGDYLPDPLDLYKNDGVRVQRRDRQRWGHPDRPRRSAMQVRFADQRVLAPAVLWARLRAGHPVAAADLVVPQARERVTARVGSAHSRRQDPRDTVQPRSRPAR